jgi:hypothetical protein
MASNVNLDALIRREDFEVESDSTQSQPVQTLQIRDLEASSFFYAALRKPDFQRETSDWSPKKIVEFVQSFLDGDLIPAIILWRSGNYNFVIDGAHRLSALIAWVNNDYGDETLSRTFFDGRIPDEQTEIATKTRTQINKAIGSFAEYKLAVSSPEKVKPEIIHRSKRLASLAVQLQWVTGDASKAEASFFKINQSAAPIDPTELKLLQSRKCPNALAARAIIRSGTGHKYWSSFETEKKQEIEELSKQIHSNLFVPKLVTPIKTLDLPIAGRGYSAQSLPLIFELVNLTNRVADMKDVAIDLNGDETIKFLKVTRQVVNRISGNHPSSLGLHPVIYFYSATGRYQPTAFLAVVGLVKDFEERNYFRTFAEIRSRFESFLLKYKNLVNQVTVKYGSGRKGFAQLKSLYWFILENLHSDASEIELLELLQQEARFSYLQPGERDVASTRKDMNTAAKSEAFLRDALAAPLRCRICEGLIHTNSISVDHIIRKADGGFGTVTNAQLTHPFCNTTIKN